MKKDQKVDDSQMSLFGAVEEKKAQGLTDEQKEFVFYKGKDSVLLKATAGSGKTHSCVHRLKELLDRGVDPSKIIFFSFTKAAVEELQKRVGNDDIKITTIHAFCMGVLFRLNKPKKVATFYEFIDWYKHKYTPGRYATPSELVEFNDLMDELYSESDYYSSQISAYKLQNAVGIKTQPPRFWKQYRQFLFEKKARDFSDMLIEVRDLFREDRYLKLFKNKYDYIFVDEYQDTSAIQMEILLSMNAKYYYLVGDSAQSIYGYSGANCSKIEEMLEKRRKVQRMSLTINFRSDKAIVENSNKYTDLEAKAHSDKEGEVNTGILFGLDDLVDIFAGPGEIVGLVRTNSTIRRLEREFLQRQVPIKYFNYITPQDVKDFKSGKVGTVLKNKLNRVKKYFEDSEAKVIAFITANSNSRKYFTSIHKSKGREYDMCIVVNSIAEEVLQENGVFEKMSEKQLERVSFIMGEPEDQESQNIHYVAVSRSKHSLYFMMYDI